MILSVGQPFVSLPFFRGILPNTFLSIYDFVHTILSHLFGRYHFVLHVGPSCALTHIEPASVSHSLLRLLETSLATDGCCSLSNLLFDLGCTLDNYRPNNPNMHVQIIKPVPANPSS